MSIGEVWYSRAYRRWRVLGSGVISGTHIARGSIG